MNPSSSSSSLKTVMKSVGKAGSAVRALATGSSGHSGNSGSGSSSASHHSHNSPHHSQQQPNAGIVHGQVINAHKAAHDYITKMIAQVSGLKALLLDADTTAMVGLVYTQSDLINQGVFLVESINVIADGMVEEAREEADMRRTLRKGKIMKGDVGLNEQSMQHLKAIVFMQPTSVSLEKLSVLMRSPRYREYHIFFNNIVPPGFLDALARFDVHNSIKQVHEYYFDYFVVTPSLFHMNSNITTATEALRLNNTYSSAASWSYDRDLQGILSLLLSLKKRPDIRYMAGSDACKKLSLDLNHIMREEQELFTFQNEPTLLLVMDRKEDVVTPLLTQWTYQSMVHELLTINLNRVLLEKKGAPTAYPPGYVAPEKSAEEKEKDALRDVILSPDADEFFKSSMFVNFGELGIRVKNLVAEFQALTKTQTKLETVDDMARFVENYPQFKMQSVTVAKHVSVMGAISEIVNQRKLLTVSAIEQELVCTPSGTSEHAEVFGKLMKLMEDREIVFLDKLRVVTLYALRYESAAHGNNLPQLLGLLRAYARVSGYSETIVEVIDKVLALAYGHTRTWPLFTQDADALSLKSVVKSIQTGVKGIENIYTQHKSMMHDILSTLFAGELKTMQFPFVEGGNPKTIYRRIIVYVVGGCTYEEYASVESLLNHPRHRGNYTVVVGGSSIHNSTSFLKEIVDIESYRLRAGDSESHDYPRRTQQPINTGGQQTQYQPIQQQQNYPPQPSYPPPAQSQYPSSSAPYRPPPQFQQQQAPPQFQPQQQRRSMPPRSAGFDSVGPSSGPPRPMRGSMGPPSNRQSTPNRAPQPQGRYIDQGVSAFHS